MYPEDLDPAWNPRFPELAYAANSISLLMPFAEPYFVRSVRSALPQLDEPLRSRTEGFLDQELEHHRQHRRFNQLITRRHPRLVRIEGWMRRTYSWFGRTRSLRWNLAFAAGSETLAYAIARWTEAHLHRLFDGADPVASTLFLWHLAEEVEHKTAAFDVFEAVDGSRLRYTAAMLTSFAILAFFTTTATLTMVVSDRRWYHPRTWLRLLTWGVSLAFEMLPTMLVSALPGHHPSDLADPTFLPRWLSQYDPATQTMPLWTSEPR